MKKFIALFVALVLCLSMATVAFAEADVAVIEWADVEAAITEAGIEGEFYGLEDLGLMFWVPSVMQPIDPPEDGNTYLAAFATEDESAMFVITITEPNEAVDYDTYLAALQEAEGVEDASVVVINGLAAIAYTVNSEEGAGNVVSIISDDGCVLSFIFNAGDADYEAVSAFICSSIQAME